MYLVKLPREPFIILPQNPELLDVAKSCTLPRELRKMMDLYGHDAELALHNILRYSGKALSTRLNTMGVTKLPADFVDRLRSERQPTFPEASREGASEQDHSPMEGLEYESLRIVSDGDAHGTLLTHIDLGGDNSKNSITERPSTPTKDEQQKIKEQSSSPTSSSTAVGDGEAGDESVRSVKKRRHDDGCSPASNSLVDSSGDSLFVPLTDPGHGDLSSTSSAIHENIDFLSELHVCHHSSPYVSLLICFFQAVKQLQLALPDFNPEDHWTSELRSCAKSLPEFNGLTECTGELWADIQYRDATGSLTAWLRSKVSDHTYFGNWDAKVETPEYYIKVKGTRGPQQEAFFLSLTEQCIVRS